MGVAVGMGVGGGEWDAGRGGEGGGEKLTWRFIPRVDLINKKSTCSTDPYSLHFHDSAFLQLSFLCESTTVNVLVTPCHRDLEQGPK